MLISKSGFFFKDYDCFIAIIESTYLSLLFTNKINSRPMAPGLLPHHQICLLRSRREEHKRTKGGFCSCECTHKVIYPKYYKHLKVVLVERLLSYTGIRKSHGGVKRAF